MPIKKIAITDINLTTWTVPADWDNANNSIELVGSGGAGEDANNSATGQCNGAGGGAYAKLTNFQLTPGQTVYINVGKYLSTKDTWINKTINTAPTVIANGGLAKGGQDGTVTAIGLGGQAAQCIGNTTFSGGNGGLGTYNATNINGGGGGGGAAGPNGAGKAGGAGSSANSGNNGGGGGGGANGGLSTAGTAGSSINGTGGTGPSGTPGGGVDLTFTSAYEGSGGQGGQGNQSAGGDGIDFPATTPDITVNYSGVIYGVGGGGGGCAGAGLGVGLNIQGGAGGPGGLYGGGGGGQRSYSAPPINQPGGEPIFFPVIPNGSNGIIFITYGTETRTPIKLVFTESTTWTVPNNWDSTANTVELIGGGGAGARFAGAGGGGGGNYCKVTNANFSKQQVYNIVIGAGGIDTNDPNATTINGGDTSIIAEGSINDLVAIGGLGSGFDIGGQLFNAGSSVGYDSSILYYGGIGGNGNTITFAGGGGGGAGSPAGNGKAGGGGDPAVAGDDGGGGGGGAGGASSTAGTTGGGNGGAGGQGPAGTGSGAGGTSANGTAGTLGGGGGGGDQSTNGGAGGAGINLGTATAGGTYGAGGGGGGGGGATTTIGGAGGLYGGGGGGGNAQGGSGGKGVVFITYYPVENPIPPKVITVVS